MQPIRRILAAVDFSEHSLRAAEVASVLAKSLGAELHVVHAFDLRDPLLNPYEISVPDDYVKLCREAAQRRLDEVIAHIAEQGVHARPHVAEAPAARAIADLAERLEADLVVMGTRGNTGLKHLALGSVAERVLRLAPCSVWTVR